MPTNRRRLSRKLRDRTPDAIYEWLAGDMGQVGDFDVYLMSNRPEATRRLWMQHRQEILDQWQDTQPCRRPWAWWLFESPGRRQRLGGVGELRGGYRIHIHEGVPVTWDPTSLDADDLPLYESQAAFLERHGLLSAREIEILRKNPALLDPERMSVDEK